MNPIRLPPLACWLQGEMPSQASNKYELIIKCKSEDISVLPQPGCLPSGCSKGDEPLSIDSASPLCPEELLGTLSSWKAFLSPVYLDPALPFPVQPSHHTPGNLTLGFLFFNKQLDLFQFP